MALDEDIQNDVVGGQIDVPIDFTDEVLESQLNECPTVVDHNQDDDTEKLELNDQAQKPPSSMGNVAEIDISNEEREKSPLLSKLKTNQKLDARGIVNPSRKVSSPTAGVYSNKKTAVQHNGGFNGRPSQTYKGSLSLKPGFATRSNGGTSKFLEAENSSEAMLSTSRISLKQAHARKSHSNFTVPQPFALATDKRASMGGQLQSGGKPYVSSKSFNSQNIREIEKKGLDNRADDAKCQEPSTKVEETKSQSKASANTFNFNSDVRAARRKEFNSKVEERLTAREAEKTQAQAKTKEDIQTEIKRFRKSLTFKATPMPAFYQDSTPPKLEIKKIPPTRARSPKLGRRNSTTGMHAGLSAANQNSNENSSQMKVSKPASEAQDLKKPTQKTPKQVLGPNSSSRKAVPNTFDNETSAMSDRNSTSGTENKVVGQFSKAPISSDDFSGEESCVQPNNGKPAGAQLDLPALSHLTL